MQVKTQDKNIRCNLCIKFDNKETFSDIEKKQIADITKKTLHFLVERGIPSIPKNFKRWFNVFTYLAEHNLLYDDIPLEKLIRICKELNKDEKSIDSNKLRKELKAATDTLNSSIKEILNISEEYSKSLSKGDAALLEASKDLESEDIKSILNYVLEEMRRIKKENEKFKKRIEEENKKVERLQRQLQVVEEEANTDYLTGLYNRRAFMNILNNLFEGYREFGTRFSLILLDIDNFKKINDTYGHDVGDAVLKDVAQVLKKYLRPEDIPARFGGEEFAVVVLDADKDIAFKVAERIRKVMETRHLKVDDSTVVDYTASFGVASVEDGIDNIDQLIKKADDNLYKAKNSGKNCVVA